MQMDDWCQDFDNWGVVDTVCCKLFDRTPHAFAKIRKWAQARDEWTKRAGVVLFACVSLHDKTSPDEKFLSCLPLIEQESHRVISAPVNRTISHRICPLAAGTSESLLRRSTDGMIAASTGCRPVQQQLRCNTVISMRESSSGATLTSSIWRRIRMATAGWEGAE
jgi:hypothetical protein